MIKKLTLIAAATLCLYGCGGGSSGSSSVKPPVTPQERFDYPIAGSTFAPLEDLLFNYAENNNGQAEEDFTLHFIPVDHNKLLEQNPDEGEEIFKDLINALINSGVTQFYKMENAHDDEDDGDVLFVGTDGYLRQISDFYAHNPKYLPYLRISGKILPTKGEMVKEADANIDITTTNISTKFSLSGTSTKQLLEHFESDAVVQAIPDTAECSIYWEQQHRETGKRKTFVLDGKRVEAAYLQESSTYNIDCQLESTIELSINAERWFNPSLGIIEQTEQTSIDQKLERTENMWLKSVTTAQ
ncbi:hypothetical protein ACNTOD_002577 [Vibrio navarrensis]